MRTQRAWQTRIRAAEEPETLTNLKSVFKNRAVSLSMVLNARTNQIAGGRRRDDGVERPPCREIKVDAKNR
ncbi:hypothetical protein EYF80_043837 [Liparis tanakae]|uniref:Uncharacterized protein n=1 Tax=Liparis tanakae TaxID=230148 RepID=A0A4Z2FXF2_9TELE|nr:hypothetical protein EYF80_043837 [Liparis tanakae]